MEAIALGWEEMDDKGSVMAKRGVKKREGFYLSGNGDLGFQYFIFDRPFYLEK